MPQLHVTTNDAKQVWASPDGQRVIYSLTLDYQGKPVTAKTYSEAIATIGWTGTVDTYEKQGRNGIETFVKQPPKAGFSAGPGGTGGRSYGGNQDDPFTMYLSYVKDIAVALITTKAYTNERLAEIVNDVAVAGEQLFDARPSAEDKVEDTPQEPVTPSLGVAVKQDVVHEVLPGQITIEDIKGVFEDDEA